MNGGRSTWSMSSRGAAFVTVGVLGGVLGLILSERQVVRVAVLLIMLDGVAAVLLVSNRRGLHTAGELSAPRVEAGRTVDLLVTVSSTGRIPTAELAVGIAVPDGLSGGGDLVLAGPRPGVPATLAVPLRARVRGRYRIPPVTVETRDALGLWRVRRRETAALELTVLPRADTLRGALPATGTVTNGSGGSRATGTAGDPDSSVREYRSGDDRRRVHWRSTARRGELMVRGEEQQRQAAVTVLLDTRAGAHRHPGAHGSFETAVVATASIVRHLLMAGHDVRLAGAPGRDPSVTVRARSARTMAELERLVDARCVGERRQHNCPVAEVLPPADHSVLVAVLGGITAADVPALRAARAGRPDALALLLDVDSWELGTYRNTTEARQHLNTLAGSLRRAGWRTAVLGRDGSVAGAWASLAGSAPATTATSVRRLDRALVIPGPR